MKKTSYFTSSFYEVGSIEMESVCGIHCCEPVEFNKIDHQTIFTYIQYNATMHGPFITFKKYNVTQESGFDEFYIFSLYYMIRKTKHDSLQLVPIHQLLQTAYIIKFETESECNQWIDKIRKVRSVISDMDFNLPPAVAEVTVYGNDLLYVGSFELSFVNNRLVFNTSNKSTAIAPLVINTDSYIVPPSESECSPDSTRGRSILVRSRKTQQYTISFVTEDFMKFSFLTIFLSIKQQLKSSKPKTTVFAQTIHSSEYETIWPDAEYVCMPQSPVLPLPEPTKQIKMKSNVPIPEKASSHLELLKFDLPINRTVYFAKVNQIELKSKNQDHQKENSTTFLSEIAKIHNEIGVQIPPLYIRPANPKLLKYKNDFLEMDFKTPGHELSQRLVSKPLFSKETADLLKEFNFDIPQQMQPTYGQQFITKISQLIPRIKENRLDDDSVRQIITILTKILTDNHIDSFYKEFSQMHKMDIENADKMAIFISQKLFTGKLMKFVSSFTTESFRSLYQPSSMFYDPDFVELLQGSLQPIIKLRFSGIFQGLDSSLRISPRFDTKVRIDSNVLRQKLSVGEEVPKYLLADIVYNISEFLKESYQPPAKCFFQAHRNPFYLFQVAISGIIKDTTQILALKHTVSEITTKSSDKFIESAIITGLKIGMTAHWIAAVIYAARVEKLYVENSYITDDVFIANLIDSLNSLSSIFFEIEESHILSYENPFF